MDSKLSLLPRLFLAGCVAMFSHAALAQESFVPQRPKVISLPSAENVKELYVAIMGEVAKPGTYHLDSASLKLQSVVQRAGGLTSDASPTIRVVRQGRVTQKEVYSDNASTPLFPGDLLVVDEKRSVPKAGQQYSFANEPMTVHAKYEERSNAHGVQIALVNLVDYPLVVRLRPDEANAVNIVERLGQPIELLANTYVITPDTFPRSTSETAKRAIRLAQGSVMVFDRDRVNRHRLPSTLPMPIESDIAMGAQPGLIGGAWGQSPELRNLGQQMVAGTQESNEFDEQFQRRMQLPSTEAVDGSPEQSMNENRSGVIPSIGAKRPRIANLPFKGAPRFATSSTISSSTDSNGAIPQPDDMTSDPSLPQVAPSLTIDDASSPKAFRFSGIQLLVLAVVVGALVAGALLLRHVLESAAIDRESKETMLQITPLAEAKAVVTENQMTSKSLLERLIKNELPISVETVAFPDELVLQGKIAPKPILRVDGSQSILKQNGPHFGSAVHSTVDSVPSASVAQVDAAEMSAVRRPHFLDSERQTSSSTATTSPTARHETDVTHGGDQPNAPLAKALFQLEQGGRS